MNLIKKKTMDKTYSILNVFAYLFIVISITSFIVYKLSYAIGIYIANHQ